MNPKPCRGLLILVLALILRDPVFSQACPTSNTTTITGNYPNTYYPAQQASVPAGSKSISLGSAVYGSHTIVAGDILLLIQMQGAAITSFNSSNYGAGSGTGTGYRNDGNLYAGRMEFVVAANTVAASGGTLNLKSGTTYPYLNQAYNGLMGQFTYQVIYVPVYYDLTLGSQIVVPAWNGSSGGVLIFAATDIFNFNGQTILGAGFGFRGGATRELFGGTGDNPTDYVTMSTINNNGGKGEGLAGTPRFVNNNGTLLDNGSNNEGYPSGAEGRGAPGNAGGGGTDYDPSQNDQNDGGGGGGNGGIGGSGGNSWSTNKSVGGIGGSVFAQAGPSRLVMGGGGGGGTSNNGTGGDNGFYSSGVSGGAIVIIYAGAITGTGTINVNGSDGYTSVQNDGSGGAGAGGGVLIFDNTDSNVPGVTVTANGGTGGSNSGNGAKHGPGGGGGGGVIYSNIPIGTTSAAGGAAGTTYSGSNYGATVGTAGVITQNISATQVLSFPVSCTLLPVNFLSFAAQPSNNKVALNWVVESQTATNYDVERSFDGSSFNVIGSLPADPKNNVSNSYTYIDNDATSPTGTFYYRIVEKDVTGQDFYSTVVAVKTASPAAASCVYPNPARESFTLTFNATAAGTVSLRLFDLSGRLMLTQPIQASTGVNAVTVNGLGTLPEGMYILQWFDGLKPYTSKVLIRH